MYKWYEEIYFWLTGKCCWCHKYNSEHFTFGGLHKYTNLTVCKDCFEKKWPTLNYYISKKNHKR